MAEDQEVDLNGSYNVDVENANIETACFGIRAAGRLIDYAPTFFASVMRGVVLALFAGLFSTWSKHPDSAASSAVCPT